MLIELDRPGRLRSPESKLLTRFSETVIAASGGTVRIGSLVDPPAVAAVAARR